MMKGFIGIYVVKAGDILSAIARCFGVSVEHLVEINDIKDPNFIRVDEVLLIPPSDLTEAGAVV